MAHRDIVAIGTSAGGVDALRFLAGEFPADLQAAVLVVIHLASRPRSSLDSILTQSGRLPATFARDGEQIRRGHIYIAPPETHLLVDGERIVLGQGPRENHTRPAIDPLFRSAALCCGPRTIGAVLTGTLGDGASGLQALKGCGGVAVVQDPNDAAFREMPENAVTQARPDHIVSLKAMPGLLAELVGEPAGPPADCEHLRFEVDIARTGRSNMSEMDRIGRRSVLTCPDCNGVMWEIEDGNLIRYRCHTGHAYAAELLSIAVDEEVRRSMASGLRAIEEKVALTRRLHDHAMQRGHAHLAQSWARQLREAEDEAAQLRTSMPRVRDLAAEFQEE